MNTSKALVHAHTRIHTLAQTTEYALKGKIRNFSLPTISATHLTQA